MADRHSPDSPLTAEVLQGLAHPDAYPEDASAHDGVEWVQTHLSHVFLTAERVYKFRKPVDLGFVRFASVGERNADCLREVQLNRRLAPDVYLGIAPLLTGGVVGPVSDSFAAEDLEHCVVMRRLPAGRDALSLLERGELSPQQVDRIAARIATFHDAHELGTPAPFTPETWRERCVRPSDENFLHLAQADESIVPAALRERAADAASAFAERGMERFEVRRLAGRAVDGHGDLHLQHVWFENPEGPPIAIDCLEFNEDLRHIDAAADVAFTAMDLRYRDESRLAERFLRRYASERDDFDLYRVVDYFIAYRAAVRAKVAALTAADPGVDSDQRRRAAESAGRHLEFAASTLDPPPPGRLVLVGGLVGSGKSTLAEALADAMDAVVISSDRVRKRLAGLAFDERTGDSWRSGLYEPRQTRRVYASLYERAESVLASGRVTILDATFGQRSERESARQLAAKLGAEAVFVEARCPRDTALARLARRSAENRDASDAGSSQYDPIAAAFEPLDEWPVASHVRIDTERDGWLARVDDFAQHMRRGTA